MSIHDISSGKPMTETSPINTDGAKWDVVLREVERCASAWEGDARLLGNVRAEDIRQAIRDAFHAIDVLAIGCGFPIVEDKPQVMGTIFKRIGRLQVDNEKLRSHRAKLLYALQAFVDYYDQAGIGECLEGHDDDDVADSFDGDERFNVRHGREAIAAATARAHDTGAESR